MGKIILIRFFGIGMIGVLFFFLMVLRLVFVDGRKLVNALDLMGMFVTGCSGDVVHGPLAASELVTLG